VIKIAKVRGASMRPTLAPGDYIIITKARVQSLHAGFVLLVDHPEYGIIVKRVKSVTDSFLRLEGDSSESTASEDMGDVPLEYIKGRVRWAITPKGFKKLSVKKPSLEA